MSEQPSTLVRIIPTPSPSRQVQFHLTERGGTFRLYVGEYEQLGRAGTFHPTTRAVLLPPEGIPALLEALQEAAARAAAAPTTEPAE